MKKLIAMLLLICTLLCLCACGTTENGQTQPEITNAQETEPENTEPEIPEGMAEYVAYLKDEGGNPIPDVMIQICKDTCSPAFTDENGKATWIYEDTTGLKVSLGLGLPEGYAYVDESVTEFYFDGTSKEITVTLKAIS